MLYILISMHVWLTARSGRCVAAMTTKHAASATNVDALAWYI